MGESRRLKLKDVYHHHLKADRICVERNIPNPLKLPSKSTFQIKTRSFWPNQILGSQRFFKSALMVHRYELKAYCKLQEANPSTPSRDVKHDVLFWLVKWRMAHRMLIFLIINPIRPTTVDLAAWWHHWICETICVKRCADCCWTPCIVSLNLEVPWIFYANLAYAWK